MYDDKRKNVYTFHIHQTNLCMNCIRSLCMLLVLLGCAAPRSASTVSKQTFNFDYKTSTLSQPGSANLLVGLVRPKYAEQFRNGQSELFASFRQYMGNDIEELLVDRGYRIKGPFDSFDDMIFEDRKDADIALEVEIVPEFTAREGSWSTYRNIFSVSANSANKVYYGYTGTASLIGKINLIAYEPLSHQKIWVKSVPIPPVQNINLSTANKRLEGTNLTNEFYNDVAVYNAIGTALSQQYASTFKKIDIQLDPREFEALRTQIRELKAKKGY